MVASLAISDKQNLNLNIYVVLIVYRCLLVYMNQASFAHIGVRIKVT